MRRVAIMEEVIERSELPSRRREKIAIAIAFVSIVIAIIAIVVSQN
jgi:hypothetical protein